MARSPSQSPSLVIEHAGAFVTVQDLGRPTLRHAGLPGGGAVDPFALRTANLLVGNPEDAAALECALVGPTLRFDQDTDIAIAGATIANIECNCRLHVAATVRLNLSQFRTGAYAYVAVAGGLELPQVLGSRSTDVRLAFGGFQGRMLRAGDRLQIGQAILPAELPVFQIAPVGMADRDRPIRVLDGKDAEGVDPAWVDKAFCVSSKSDRVGVRLDGPKVACNLRSDAPSAVVLPGTIQLPSDGVPIVLLADAQTLGGYPQIAHVIQADLPRLAQIRPGRPVRFERVTREAAHRLIRRRERELAFLRYGIRATMEFNVHDRSELRSR